jgi:MFS family permease
MLFRFSLYGFLKNQRYFEPFLLLAVLERELSFAEFGFLVAIREACQQVLEIPSGAIADQLGRKRAMVAAFAAYTVAYLVLAFASGFWLFALGLGLIGFGDAFRTGTHKAMIFDWLEHRGEGERRVEVYGYTRSWSQIGSAVSVPIAAAIVIATDRYGPVFLVSAVPAFLDLVNLATYPAELDGKKEGASLRSIARHLWRAIVGVVRNLELRRLLVEGMTFSGLHKASKDYLQPLIATVALSLPLLASLEERRAVAVVAGGIYVILHVLGAISSRHAHRFVTSHGDPERASRSAWWALAAGFAVMGLGLWFGVHSAAITAFVLVAVLHNLYRPILVSCIAAIGERGAAATVLSLESQATSTAAIVLAPALGLLVDAVRIAGLPASSELWPIAAVGATLCVIVLVTPRPEPTTTSVERSS